VAWRAPDALFDGVFLRLYDAGGAPLGGEQQVNAYTTSDQRHPHVAFDENGQFTVVWTSGVQDGSADGIFARRFAAAGTPIGGEVQVNSYAAGAQRNPVVAATGLGQFVVGWESDGEDGSSTGVQARAFAVSPTGTASPTATATETAVETSTSTATATATASTTPSATAPNTGTATSTATATPSSTASRTPTNIPSTTPPFTATATATSTSTSSPGATDTPVPSCAGDCDGDGEVAINELIVGVNIALGSAPVGDCPAFDADGDSQVSIAELIRAVGRALSGCSD